MFCAICRLSHNQTEEEYENREKDVDCKSNTSHDDYENQVDSAVHQSKTDRDSNKFAVFICGHTACLFCFSVFLGLTKTI